MAIIGEMIAQRLKEKQQHQVMQYAASMEHKKNLTGSVEKTHRLMNMILSRHGAL